MTAPLRAAALSPEVRRQLEQLRRGTAARAGLSSALFAGFGGQTSAGSATPGGLALPATAQTALLAGYPLAGGGSRGLSFNQALQLAWSGGAAGNTTTSARPAELATGSATTRQIGLPRGLTASIPPTAASALPTTPRPIQRVFQRDPAQYDTAAQVQTWGPSACSAASLTAVLRSRGVPVRIVDVMREMPYGLTPQLGLVSRPSLVKAAQHFGLGASDEAMTYDSLRQATAGGQTVLVDITNAKFPEGHWLVVTGADANGLSIVDSSGYNLTSLTRQEFTAAWSGRGIRILDRATNAPAAQGQGQGQRGR